MVTVFSTRPVSTPSAFRTSGVGMIVLPVMSTDEMIGFSTTTNTTRTPFGTGSNRTTASANCPRLRIAWTSLRSFSSLRGSFGLVDTTARS